MDNDLISRAAAIDALTNTNIKRNIDSVCDGDMNRTRRAAQRVIAQLPAVDAAPTVSHWISVNDRMPDDGQDVLVYIDDWGESRITGCNYDHGVWYDCVMNCEVVIPNITHWMPLPEPPKEEDDDDA